MLKKRGKTRASRSSIHHRTVHPVSQTRHPRTEPVNKTSCFFFKSAVLPCSSPPLRGKAQPDVLPRRRRWNDPTPSRERERERSTRGESDEEDEDVKRLAVPRGGSRTTSSPLTFPVVVPSGPEPPGVEAGVASKLTAFRLPSPAGGAGSERAPKERERERGEQLFILSWTGEQLQNPSSQTFRTAFIVIQGRWVKLLTPKKQRFEEV